VDRQMYIRMRGRVLGPYDYEKLHSMAMRGQLSRLHELSEDATNWVKASNYPDLFLSEASQSIVPEERIVESPTSTPNGPPEIPIETQWWYSKNGVQAGPVGLVTLQQMLSSGSLSPDDLVWTDGMAQWSPARSVPGVMPVSAPPIPPSSENTKFCHHCGARIASLAEICPKCGIRQTDILRAPAQPVAGPSKVVACLLAIFLGGLGAHKFYLGETGWGVMYLLGSILLCWTIFVPLTIAVVCLVEGIVYLTYSDADFARKYGPRTIA
jgi:TM2 domain-containing membrane protein YozV